MSKKIKPLPCNIDPVNKPCTQKDCPWWIKCRKYYNCFQVYKFYISRPHTLQEVANILEISHTTVKQLEDSAFNKIKNKIKLEELENIQDE